MVLPLSGSNNGGTVFLSNTASALSATFNLPTNVERAYLDVIAQSQAGDEFWYTCVPNDVANELQSCGATGFRESEVTIDGQPAGVAPVYPWIYTGGIDPLLWRPIPGVQTLNFVPYRVDLTPFAGVLSNGKPHTVSVNVFNANNGFSTTATLLAFLDHGSTQITGAVTKNTLTAAPAPNVAENLATDASGNIIGNVVVTSNRNFRVEGFVRTSHGRVETSVEQNIRFSNRQDFNISGLVFIQNITQNTSISSLTSTRGSHQGGKTSFQTFEWPLSVDINFTVNADGSGGFQTTTIKQTFNNNQLIKRDGDPDFFSTVSNTVAPTDTLLFDASWQHHRRAGAGELTTLFLHRLYGCVLQPFDCSSRRHSHQHHRRRRLPENQTRLERCLALVNRLRPGATALGLFILVAISHCHNPERFIIRSFLEKPFCRVYRPARSHIHLRPATRWRTAE